jgi:hypothetical protein
VNVLTDEGREQVRTACHGIEEALRATGRVIEKMLVADEVASRLTAQCLSETLGLPETIERFRIRQHRTAKRTRAAEHPLRASVHLKDLFGLKTPDAVMRRLVLSPEWHLVTSLVVAPPHIAQELLWVLDLDNEARYMDAGQVALCKYPIDLLRQKEASSTRQGGE